jgi:hypothetical protein
MADLNSWQHAIHQVTGDTALRFNKATTADLNRWAKILQEARRYGNLTLLAVSNAEYNGLIDFAWLKKWRPPASHDRCRPPRRQPQRETVLSVAPFGCAGHVRFSDHSGHSRIFAQHSLSAYDPERTSGLAFSSTTMPEPNS